MSARKSSRAKKVPVVCSSTAQGKRPYQEDRALSWRNGDIYVFGVFDGHGGSDVSKVLPNAYKVLTRKLDSALFKNPQRFKDFVSSEVVKMDQELLKKLGKGAVRAGSTANVGFYDAATGIFYSLNLGDSRGVFVQVDKKRPMLKTSIMERTTDHKPEMAAEKRRIKKEGGFVSSSKPGSEVMRTGGVLAMSRAHGDFELKTPYKSGDWVSSVPVIMGPRYLDEANKQFVLLIGSDGIFDVLKNHQLKQHVVKRLKESGGTLTKAQLQAVCRELVDKAIEEWNKLPRGVGDNTTLTIAYLA